MIFVDTNYFLRFLLKDIDKQHQEAKELFKDAALGEVKLFTSIIVFFEIYWVFSSFYKRNKTELTEILKNVLKMDFIKIKERKLLQKAVEIFEESTSDLEDSFNLAYARKKEALEFKTFDKKLVRKFRSHFSIATLLSPP